MIGPLINIPAVNKPNMIHLSRADHDAPVLIFSQTKSPIAKITSASGMSDRTSVASRGLNKLKPKAAKAIRPAILPYARDALRCKRNAISTAQTSDGNRHAMSHERATAKIAADVHPVSGGLVARP